jgi:hypothetical protein
MIEHPVEKWRRIVEARAVYELDDLLAADVTFVSPIAHRPIVGKALATAYLSAALDVFANSSFRYIREIAGATDAMLEFEVRIDQTNVNGVDLLAWNEAGEIVEFKVLLRPLKAILLVKEKMEARLAAGAGGRQPPSEGR